MQASSTLVTFRRGILRGLLTVKRERQWSTALGALFGVLLLVQLLALMLLGLQGIETLLRHRTDLRLEIQEGASDRSIRDFYSALSAEPYVEKASLITKTKAYEEMRTSDPQLIAFLEEFKLQNPFNDTISINLNNLDDYGSFSKFIEDQRWKDVVNPAFLSQVSGQEKQVYALISVTQTAGALMGLILAVTAGALVFIVTELTRRRALARSDEVLVERLVGATPLSILLPFATEATALFFIAIIASAAALVLLLAALPMLVPGIGEGGPLSGLREQVVPLLSTMLPVILLCEILASPVIAAAGAWLGIRPQVESPRIAYAV